MNAKVEQRDKTFHFHIPDSQGIVKEIALIQEDANRLLLQTEEESFDILLDSSSKRPYFEVQMEGKSDILAQRTLPIEGMNNFRDLGGYTVADGRHVKWGLLYRSDHLYNATQGGIAYLKRLDIHTIIDYRSQNERTKYPNPVIGEEVMTYCLDPDAHAAELAAQFASSKDAEDENLVNKIIEQKENGKLVNRYDIVMEQYGNFANKAECKEAFKKMLQICADPNAGAIVQHCRGGKDRTGFGSMLLLGVLGVSKKDLVDDYMITYDNRIKRNQVKMERYQRFTQDPVVLDYLYSLIDTKPAFIEASYDAIVNKYGSIQRYVEQGLGVSSQVIQTLKDLYLE